MFRRTLRLRKQKARATEMASESGSKTRAKVAPSKTEAGPEPTQTRSHKPTPEEIQVAMNEALKVAWLRVHPGQDFPVEKQAGKW